MKKNYLFQKIIDNFNFSIDEKVRLIETINSKRNYVPFQLCPKCNGKGILEMQNENLTVTFSFTTCDVCDGRKIILMARNETS